MNTKDQPSDAVVRTGGASIGTLLAIIIGWAAQNAGYEMSSDVSLAIGALLGSFATEISNAVHAYLNRNVATLPANQVVTTKVFNPQAPEVSHAEQSKT